MSDPSAPQDAVEGVGTEHRAPGPRGRSAAPAVDVPVLLLAGIFCLMLLAALRVARSLVLPFALALLGHLTLTPAIRWMERARIPRPVGAAVVVAVLLSVVAGGTSLLAAPASRWVNELPRVARRVEGELRFVREPMEDINEAAKSVEELAAGGPATSREVTLRGSSLTELVFAGTQNAIATGVLVTALLYLLLASGDVFLWKLVTAARGVEGRRRAIGVLRAAESEVSRYLFTISIINGALGITVAAAMWLIGMPNPLLWGAMAAIFNFVPFLGALAGTLVLSLVALLTFESPARMVLAPLSLVLITGFEGLVLTPSIVGRRFRLNPVVILSGLLLGGWLWGVPGALIAVPTLVVIRIVAGHSEILRPLASLMSR